MKKIAEEIVDFLDKQNFVIVSTIDNKGFPHTSCKGIIKIDKRGRITLIDLYRGKTLENIKQNPYISITAVDEHKFQGYCLKGKGEILPLKKDVSADWGDIISKRITQRLLKNIRGEKGHPSHPEVSLPSPKYLIEIEIKEIVNLKPPHIT